MDLNLKTLISSRTKEAIEGHSKFYDNLREGLVDGRSDILWKRMSDVASFRNRLFPENFHTLKFLDIEFGSRTNKVFLTALQGLLTIRNGYKLIKRLFISGDSVVKNGIYSIQFCIGERWKEFCVDESIPFENTERSRSFFLHTASKDGLLSKGKRGFHGDSIFSRSKDCIFLALLEKAYNVALKGNKRYLSVTNLLTIMNHLTGSINYRIDISNHLFFADLMKLRTSFPNVLIFGKMKKACTEYESECAYYSLLGAKNTFKKSLHVLEFSNNVMMHDANRTMLKTTRLKGSLEQLNLNVVESTSHFYRSCAHQKLFVEWSYLVPNWSNLLLFPILFWKCDRFQVYDKSVIVINIKKASTKVIVQVLQFEEDVKPLSFRILSKSKKEMIFISEYSELNEIKTSEILLKKGVYYLQTRIFDPTKMKRGILKIFRNRSRNVQVKMRSESIHPDSRICPIIMNKAMLSLFLFHQCENINVKEEGNWVILKSVKISDYDRLIAVECKKSVSLMVHFKVAVILSDNIQIVEGVESNTFDLTEKDRIFLCRLKSVCKKKPCKFRIVYKFL